MKATKSIAVKEHKQGPSKMQRLQELQESEPVALKIPVCLKLINKDILGYTESISLTGLHMVSSAALVSGTPMALHFSFGDNLCYLNVSGQVVSCVRAKEGAAGQYAAHISLVAIREFERNILRSAVEELRRDPAAQGKSLLTMHVSKDLLAEEGAKLSAESHDASLLTDVHTRRRRRGKFAPDPAWVLELKHHIAPHWEAILQCRLIQEASAGTLSLKQMRAWLAQLYPFIESFPKWLALNIAKTQDPRSRGFLIDNVRVEKRHAEHWVYMAQGFGIHPDELHTLQAIPAVDALSHWLWSINTQGTLAEAVGATSFAIEGVTQDIAKSVVKGLPRYEGLDGVRLDRKAYWWMEAHARYDELHPVQALEIMKLYTTTKDLEEKVKFAAQRSLEYLLMALEACYTQFEPNPAKKKATPSSKVPSASLA